MRYRYLLTGLALIGLLVSVDTAWGGAANINPGEREENFVHICQGGPNNGESCTVSTVDGERIVSGCPEGQCNIDFVTGVIQGTLFLNVDEDATVSGFPLDPDGCDSCDPEIQDCDSCRLSELKRLADTTLTALLTVTKDRQTHFFAETYVSPDTAGVIFEEFREITESGLPNESDLQESNRRNFLFLAPDGPMAQGLRALFIPKEVTNLSIVPIIVKITKIRKSSHESDQLASVSQLIIRFRFVRSSVGS